jgi:hypothetical protein
LHRQRTVAALDADPAMMLTCNLLTSPRPSPKSPAASTRPAPTTQPAPTN